MENRALVLRLLLSQTTTEANRKRRKAGVMGKYPVKCWWCCLEYFILVVRSDVLSDLAWRARKHGTHGTNDGKSREIYI